MKRLLVALVAGFSPAFILMLSIQTSRAGSATWKRTPVSVNWNRAENWNPQTIPNGPSDTATFAISNRTMVSLSAHTEVNGIVFNAIASAFTITADRNVALNISGVGITNNTGVPQNFVTAGTRLFATAGKVEFTNSATAGSLTFFTNEGSGVNSIGGGIVQFSDNSSAGSGTFVNQGAAHSGPHSGAGGGMTFFLDHSTAANGTFTNKGGTRRNGFGGGTLFLDNSTAGNSTVVNEPGTVFGAGGSFTSFRSNSTAGSGTFTNNGGEGAPGVTSFSNDSTAGDATFNNNNGGSTQFGHGFGEAPSAGDATFTNDNGGFVQFAFNATAGDAIFINNGGAVSGGYGGVTDFLDNSTAGNGTFINNGGTVSGAHGGETNFSFDSPTAGNATLIANGGLGGGGLIQFFFDSTGGTTRIEVFDNGALDISLHYAPGISIGSIEGSGLVFLGALNLTVGSNNLSTTFSGVIQDGGLYGGTGASLTKVGTGTLALGNSNAYTGGTTINGGKLVLRNDSGSGTGSGPVQVNVGTLGGDGIIAGAVTVGNGSGPEAVLLPGKTGRLPGTLTIQSSLTFKSDATYKFSLNSDTATSDSVIATGVTIHSGAQFSFIDVGNGTLPLGTVFTVINNAAATPIVGTFSDLADGSTFRSNGNTYRVNYQGGDGNDLTLRVVP
jgi:autotransporter-associated beta strand protein